MADLDAILLAIQPLLTGLVNIALAHNWLATSALCMKLQPALVQALPADASPLAQLPEVGLETARELEITKGAEGKRWLEKYIKNCEVSHETRFLVKSWPRLEVVSAEFKGELRFLQPKLDECLNGPVPGEKIVTPSAMVQLNFRCRYIYPDTPSSGGSEGKSSLPNGHVATNGDREDINAEPKSTGAVDDAVDRVDEKTNGDIKQQISDAKEVIAEKVESAKEGVKQVGQKGKAKSAVKEKIVPNGYAHAPHWPLVGSVCFSPAVSLKML